MVAQFDIELQQMDVKTAFLHGYLDEQIVMEQPEDYIDKKYPNKVYLLKRSLYGLKQSPRQWNLRFVEYVLGNGYLRSSYDSCVYLKKLGDGSYVYLLLYVDDMLIALINKSHVEELKVLLINEFEMKNLGDAKKILGMEITRDRVAGTLITLTEAVKEATWLKGLAEELGFPQEFVEVHCDSQSVINALSKNSVHHEQTKHIDIRLHYIRDVISKGLVKVVKIASECNPADIFTKVLPVNKFEGALELLRVTED
ncbi:Retrovirus-related Pol polyprotein from transposon TNT 1-94 [Cardamine amara subsp. amara]|uniref:Retrovirus-related Pol polyprotein from transposon TNT 1-94 n=1 Tax=Cardamine amara subsp. amara TaxID=228776 RepID=A0ABD1AB09_CARAN